MHSHGVSLEKKEERKRSRKGIEDGVAKKTRKHKADDREGRADHDNEADCAQQDTHASVQRGEKVYRKVDEISHVLGRPGMYIGATKPSTCEMDILVDEETVREITDYNETCASDDYKVEINLIKNADALVTSSNAADVDTDRTHAQSTGAEAISSTRVHDVPESDDGSAVVQGGTRVPAATTPAEAAGTSSAETATRTATSATAPTLNRQTVGSATIRARVSSGLVRLLIEALQNAVDAAFDDERVSRIEVDINATEGWVQVCNNGGGIPVKESAEGHRVLVPELVFGHLRAGSNFGDLERDGSGADRLGSGLNGVGITLANIFSTRFEASTGDVASGKEWHMTWKNNSKDKEPGVVKRYSRKNGYVRVKFFPDMSHFTDPCLPATGVMRGNILSDGGGGRVCEQDVKGRVAKVFDAGLIAVFKSCVYDLVAVVPDRVSVYLNGRKIVLKGLVDYARVMGATNGDGSRVRMIVVDSVSPDANGKDTARRGHRGSIRAIVCPSGPTTPPRPVGFVNGIRCSVGAHVDHVLDAIKNVVQDAVQTTRGVGKDMTITRARVRQMFWVCVLARVPNPHFKNQTKEELDMTVAQLRCSVNPFPSSTVSSIRAVAKPLLKALADRTKAVADVAALQRSAGAASSATKGTSSSAVFGSGNVIHHPKLADAANAGPLSARVRRLAHSERRLRRLYVAEGDSAGELVKCGLRASVDPENCGVLVARGKILNVRNTDLKRIAKNEFVVLMSRALGLTPGKEYATEDDLKAMRYDYLVAFADQDSDGHHIVGLLVNAVDYLFPGLFKLRPDFIKRFATPVVRCASARSGLPDATFLTLQDFNRWYTAEQQRVYPPSKVRYLKGLGGSAGPEAREYFTHERQLSVTLQHTGLGTSAALSVLFSDDLANERKRILSGVAADAASVAQAMRLRGVLACGGSGALVDPQSVQPSLDNLVYSPDAAFDYGRDAAPFEEYAQKAVTHFSWEDVERSMPDLSGFKEVHRKVIHGFLVKNIRSVRKVGVAVAECTAASHYNHGEQSITEATVGLAQMHMGTNNVPLLVGVGQFGTRNNPPDKHAAPRYLSVHLSPLLDHLLPRADAVVLSYKVEEGRVIEPEQFSPVVPWVLVNGTTGIATGWSTTIPPFNPQDVLNATRVLAQLSLSARRDGGMPRLSEMPTPTLGTSRVDATALAGVDLKGLEDACRNARGGPCRPPLLEHVYGTEEFARWQEETDGMVPWADMFSGRAVVVYDAGRPKSVVWKGKYRVGEAGGEDVARDPSLRLVVIDELPVGTWTSTWKARLYERNFITPPAGTVDASSPDAKADTAESRRHRFVKDARIKETDVSVKIELLCDSAAVAPHLEATEDGVHFPLLEKSLALASRQSMQNMHVFDHNLALRRMTYVHEFFTSHFEQRYRTYLRRIDHSERSCVAHMRHISNKYRFVLMLVREEYTMNRKSVSVIDRELGDLGFDSDQALKALQPTSSAPDGRANLRPDQQLQNNDRGDGQDTALPAARGEQDSSSPADTFAYLRRMPIDSVSEDVLRSLEKEKSEAELQLEKIRGCAVEELWLEDLDSLEAALVKAREAKRKEYNDKSTSTLASAPKRTETTLKNSKAGRSKGKARDAKS